MCVLPHGITPDEDNYNLNCNGITPDEDNYNPNWHEGGLKLTLSSKILQISEFLEVQ